MTSTLHSSPTDFGSRTRLRPGSTWRRVTAVGVATALLSLGTVSAGAAVPAGAGPSFSRLSSADSGDQWSGDQWSADQWNGDQSSGGSSPYGDGSSGQDGQSSTWGQSGSSTTTVDSQPATAAESRGVVLIDTVLGYQDAAAAGTGIVLTSNGEVLTNYHVVEGSTTVRVTIASTGKTYSATVVGHDQSDDIAVLQLTGASGLATATIDDDPVRTGDTVSAVGNAGGTDSLTAADGTVTSLAQSITTASESGVAGETLANLIATDADVVAGDSGGPLYDDQGEVIGIDTAASTGSEINGYAIPIATALTIVQQIRAGHQTNSIRIGPSAFLGVEVSSGYASQSDSTGDGYAYPGQDAASEQSSGALVAGVEDDTPAARAGLQAGDTITAIGGTTVTSADQVSALLQKHERGDTVKVAWTDSIGDHHTASVTLSASPVA